MAKGQGRAARGQRLFRPTLIAALVLVAAGCGGSSPEHRAATTHAASTTPPAPTLKTVDSATGRDYVRLVAPMNTALDVFKKKTDGYTSTTPSARIAKDTAPVVGALKTFDDAILRQNWPPSVRAHVRAMVQADAAMRSDLEQMANTGDWSGLTRDAEASSAAVNVVRADLGLPPPPQ